MKVKRTDLLLIDALVKPSSKSIQAQLLGDKKDAFTDHQQSIISFDSSLRSLKVNYPDFFKNIKSFKEFEIKINSFDKNINSPQVKQINNIETALGELKTKHDKAPPDTATAYNACQHLFDLKILNPTVRSDKGINANTILPKHSTTNTFTDKKKVNPFLVAGLVMGGVLLAAGVIALIAATGGLAAIGIAAGVGVAAVAAPAAVVAAGGAIMGAVGITNVYKEALMEKELEKFRGANKQPEKEAKLITSPKTHLENTPYSPKAAKKIIESETKNTEMKNDTKSRSNSLTTQPAAPVRSIKNNDKFPDSPALPPDTSSRRSFR